MERFDKQLVESGLNLSHKEKQRLDDTPLVLDGLADTIAKRAREACRAGLAEAGEPAECGLNRQPRNKFLSEDYVFCCDKDYCPAAAPAAARDELATKFEHWLKK